MIAFPQAVELSEVVLELAPWMDPDDVEREVAGRYPWLDDDRLAAVWLYARRVHEGPRFVRVPFSESSPPQALPRSE